MQAAGTAGTMEMKTLCKALPGNDVDHTTHGIRPIQSRCRATHNFYLLYVMQGNRQGFPESASHEIAIYRPVVDHHQRSGIGSQVEWRIGWYIVHPTKVNIIITIALFAY